MLLNKSWIFKIKWKSNFIGWRLNFENFIIYKPIPCGHVRQVPHKKKQTEKQIIYIDCFYYLDLEEYQTDHPLELTKHSDREVKLEDVPAIPDLLPAGKNIHTRTAHFSSSHTHFKSYKSYLQTVPISENIVVFLYEQIWETYEIKNCI